MKTIKVYEIMSNSNSYPLKRSTQQKVKQIFLGGGHPQKRTLLIMGGGGGELAPIFKIVQKLPPPPPKKLNVANYGGVGGKRLL